MDYYLLLIARGIVPYFPLSGPNKSQLIFNDKLQDFNVF